MVLPNTLSSELRKELIKNILIKTKSDSNNTGKFINQKILKIIQILSCPRIINHSK